MGCSRLSTVSTPQSRKPRLNRRTIHAPYNYGGDVSQNYKCTGKERDAESGLRLLRGQILRQRTRPLPDTRLGTRGAIDTAIYMTSIFALVLLAVSSSYPISAVTLQDDTNLCAIQDNPPSYVGRTVTVSAILSSTGEFRAFRDDACPARLNPRSGKHDFIEATFDQEEYDFRSGNHKKLMTLLKKRWEAHVVVVATFVDPGRYGGNSDCCRYELKIRKLISVEKVPPSKVRHVS